MNRPKVLGLSDPLTAPTGFGRVARELYARLGQTEQFDLGYLARGWVGTTKVPGVTAYADSMTQKIGEGSLCQNALPMAALDFAGADPFVLWTLLDAWQASWLALPDTSPYRTRISTDWLAKHRGQFAWVGYFPIDGLGPRDGPPLWVEQYLQAMDYPVAMSDWGRRVCQPYVKREIRFISHAVDTGVFFPMNKDAARAQVQGQYLRDVAALLAHHYAANGEQKPLDDVMAEATSKVLRLEGAFVVLCVMANRPRKYWWDVLQAFKGLTDAVPRARLIALCGDRTGGANEDALPLDQLCRQLGLRLDEDGNDPQVWLIPAVGMGRRADELQRLFNAVADVALLWSGGEGFGLPQLEAHACARPCLVGNYSASTELAVDPKELIAPYAWSWVGANLIKRPIYRVKDLVARLNWAAHNPSWCDDVGQAGLAAARQRSWEAILPQWTNLLTEAGIRRPADAAPSEPDRRPAHAPTPRRIDSLGDAAAQPPLSGRDRLDPRILLPRRQ